MKAKQSEEPKSSKSTKTKKKPIVSDKNMLAVTSMVCAILTTEVDKIKGDIKSIYKFMIVLDVIVAIQIGIVVYLLGK